MQKILINSELPLQMLSKNNEVNDFDFVLFSLWEKYPEYKEFYLKNRRDFPERIVIFDNSAYEYSHNGEVFSEIGFMNAISELKPTYFIVPDVLMDSEKTLENFKRWKSFMPEYKRMVIPQGKSFREWLSCYKQIIELGSYDMIGIPFHNDFFYDMGFGALIQKESKYIEDKDYAYAFGRCLVLNYLIENRLLDSDVKYHLLGTHHWNEMKSIGLTSDEYSDHFFSADTSYPVTRGIMLKELESRDPKEKISIEEFFQMSLSEEQESQIFKNIRKFHNYVEVQED